MEKKFELLPCVGLSDRCPAVKRADKFADEIEELANSLQQLKAEIALLLNTWDNTTKQQFLDTWVLRIKKLRQLSAV